MTAVYRRSRKSDFGESDLLSLPVDVMRLACTLALAESLVRSSGDRVRCPSSTVLTVGL